MKTIFKKGVVAILSLCARLVLIKHKPKIVAVTGSVGKTSTKDAIYTVLKDTAHVRKSEKSFNSEIGVPLTILGLPNAWGSVHGWLTNIFEAVLMVLFSKEYPQWLILEIGADHPGDISRVARWLKPHVVVLTRLPDVPVHVEFFDSPEAVAQEKLSLVKAIRKDGVLIVNGDDERTRAAHRLAPQAAWYSYGFAEDATVRCESMQVVSEQGKPWGMTFRVAHKNASVPVAIRGVLGRQPGYAALAAIAVGASQGLNLVAMGRALARHTPAPGRMRILEGVRGSVVIDDTYNASPTAAEEALRALSELSVSGRKIFVLGDMLELGEYTAEAHEKIGLLAAEKADMIIGVGLRARKVAEVARMQGKSTDTAMAFDTSVEAGEKLAEILQDGDVVLIKGSQSTRMERAVAKVLAHPEEAKKQLVRQEEEWLRKV